MASRGRAFRPRKAWRRRSPARRISHTVPRRRDRHRYRDKKSCKQEGKYEAALWEGLPRQGAERSATALTTKSGSARRQERSLRHRDEGAQFHAGDVRRAWRPSRGELLCREPGALPRMKARAKMQRVQKTGASIRLSFRLKYRVFPRVGSARTILSVQCSSEQCLSVQCLSEQCSFVQYLSVHLP